MYDILYYQKFWITNKINLYQIDYSIYDYESLIENLQ